MQVTRVVMVVLIASVCLNIILGVSYFSRDTGAISAAPGTPAVLENTIPPLAAGTGEDTPVAPGDIVGYASLQAPAVSQVIRNRNSDGFPAYEIEQKGSIMNISAEIRPGKGRVLVQTTPLMGVVFQDAAKTAVIVAENRTGILLPGSDVIFSIESPDTISAVDGSSAGALMTLLMVSALEHRPIDASLTLSGTINNDGHIGAVGGLVAKAAAAKENGKTLFLLPNDNRVITISSTETSSLGMYSVSRRVYERVSTKDYIEKNIGINVSYVNTIDDVISLSLKHS